MLKLIGLKLWKVVTRSLAPLEEINLIVRNYSFSSLLPLHFTFDFNSAEVAS